MKPQQFKIIAITIIVLLIGAEVALAQFGRLRDRALDAATRRVEQRVEEHIGSKIDAAAEKVVDNAFDSVFGKPHNREDFGSDEEYEQAVSAWRASMFGSMMNVETRDEYRFSIRNHMRFTTTDRNGRVTDEGEFTFLIEPGATYSGTLVENDENNGGSVIMIFDIENGAMVMFITSDGEKMSMAYGGGSGWMDGFDGLDDEDDEPAEFGEDMPDNMQFESLGTRTIHGVTANGYRFSDDEMEMEMWIAEDGSLSGRTLGNRNPALQRNHPNAADMLPTSGLPLEMTSREKSTGETFKMESVDFNRNARIRLSRSEYPPVSFGL
jgi:hypothetical protein